MRSLGLVTYDFDEKGNRKNQSSEEIKRVKTVEAGSVGRDDLWKFKRT